MSKKQPGGRGEAGNMTTHDCAPAAAAQTNGAHLDPAPDLYDEEQYKTTFRDAPYYSTGRDWSDYAPAYRYGHTARAEHRDRRFADVEQQLAEHWDALKAQSRLVWAEARGAVLDAWQRRDASGPGDRQRRKD